MNPLALLKPVAGALGSKAGRGLMGLIGGGLSMKKGLDQVGNIAAGLGDEGKIRSVFQGSQDMLNRMSDILDFGASALDTAGQLGNQAVRAAATVGQYGGSAMNAIKARLNRGAVGDMYGQWKDAMRNIVLPNQLSLDKTVGNRLFAEQDMKNQIGMDKAQGLINFGGQMMPNMQGIFGKEGILAQAGGGLTDFLKGKGVMK